MLAGQSSSRIWVGRKPYGRDAKVAFVFGAFDAARHGGVRQAIARLPDWPEATVEVDTALSSVTGWTLSSALGDDAVWADAQRRLPATTALQLAFTNWCRTVGIAPAIVVGTGVGEIAAAAVAGIVSMADAFRWSAAVARGDMFQRGPRASSRCGASALPFGRRGKDRARHRTGTRRLATTAGANCRLERHARHATSASNRRGADRR